MVRVAVSGWVLAVALVAPCAHADPGEPAPASHEPFSCTPGDSPAVRDQYARSLWVEALHLEASDPEAALARLQCADTLVDRPNIAKRIGVVAERIGLLQLAIDAFRRYLAIAADGPPDRDAMERRIDELTHRAVTPLPSTPPATDEGVDLTVPAIAVASTGFVFAAVGAGLLGLAKSQNDDVHALQGAQWNSPEAKETFESAETKQAIGIAGLVVGGALVLGGAAMFIISQAAASSEATEQAVSVEIAPNGALTLRF